MLKEAKLGDVTLNLEHYSGRDRYSDGEVETSLLNMVREHKPEEFPEVIEERADWPAFYHFSHLRTNIIEWLPIGKGDRVLEVGSGCGALTGMLAEKAGQVDCVELSQKRSEINGFRNNTCGNIKIYVGNFEEIEPDLPGGYDWILLIGVLEYAGGFISGENPYADFLKLLHPHLAPSGRLVVAIENRLGLKYLAGCREDHLGDYFSGIEGYPGEKGIKTFSRGTLYGLMNEAGFSQCSFYYPYPDYKLPTDIYSDYYLPQPENLLDNVRNFDRERMVLFNEKNASEALLKDGLYQEFANSFLVVTGPAPEQVYIRYSNDRAEDFRIRTEILRDRKGSYYVRKLPLTEKAIPHIQGLLASCEALRERYQGSGLEVLSCVPEGEGVLFPFVDGGSLSAMFDRLLFAGDMEGFSRLFAEYVRRVGFQDQYPVSDYDMAFSNIIVKGNIWYLIDYEWTYGKTIPVSELAYRALRDYQLQDRRRSKIPLDKLYAALGIAEKDSERLISEEAEFQKYVTGGRLSLVELWKKIGRNLVVPKELGTGGDIARPDRIQIYEDKGDGYSEEHSVFPEETYDSEGNVVLKLQFGADTRAFRIDPANASCLIHVRTSFARDLPFELALSPEGKWLSVEMAVFESKDPFFEIYVPEQKRGEFEGGSVELLLTMSLLPAHMAGILRASGKKEAAESPAREGQKKGLLGLFGRRS